MKLTIVFIGLPSVALWSESSAFSVAKSLKLGAPAPSCQQPPWIRISALDAGVETSLGGLDEEIEDTNRYIEVPENDGDMKRLREELRTASLAAPSEETAEAVEKVLLQMVDGWNQNPNDANAPTASDFYTAITAWSDSESPETARRVGVLYFEQEALFERNCVAAKPTSEIVSAVLAAMSSSRERGADRRAWAMLERVLQYGIEPTAEMYTFVIRSLARSKDRSSAERAEGVLKDAITKFPPGIDESGNPTGMGVDSFNVVLTAWAKSGRYDGPTRAEELLVYMDQVHKENGVTDNLLKPNVSSFTSLIDAYAQKNDWDGVSASERMLNRLLDQFLEDGDESLEPNVASWTIVISAWTRLARKGFNKCAEKADRLLRRMEELYQEGRTTVAPDAITFVTVMNAHAADSKSPDNARKAQDILDEMNERYLDGEDDMKVTTRSIKVVIDAWIKTDNDPNAMDQAEAVLETYADMDEFQEPIDDEIVRDIYRSILFGFSKHKDPHRAEDYLKEMVSLGLKPDCFCYDRVLDSYTHLNAPDSFERTCAVFELMEQCRKDGDVKPNERVYTSFIRALTKAKVVGLARKATTVLNKMKDLYQDGNREIKPTTFTYNAVLNACAESINDNVSDNMEAFKVAIGIFNDLRNGNDGPDHVTFGNMLRCAALLPEGEQRDAVVTSTFQLCCKSGFVNSYVIRDLQYSCNEDLWRSLVKCPQGDVDCEELPALWKSAYERTQEKSFRRNNDSNRRGGGRGGRPSSGSRPQKFSRGRR